MVVEHKKTCLLIIILTEIDFKLYKTGCQGTLVCRIFKLADLAVCLPDTCNKLEKPCLCRCELGYHINLWQRQYKDRMIPRRNENF